MSKILKTINKKWPEYVMEVLVILGSILGAFALEEWNEDIEREEKFHNMLNSLNASIGSDISSLKLMAQARSETLDKVEELKQTTLNINGDIKTVYEAYFVLSCFRNITNTISWQTNSGSYQALKNFGYLGRFNGSEMEYLLNRYYAECEELKELENQYNNGVENLNRAWHLKFSDKRDIFFDVVSNDPGGKKETYSKKGDSGFADITHSPETRLIFYNAVNEWDLKVKSLELIGLCEILSAMLSEKRWQFNDAEKSTLSGLIPGYSGYAKMNILKDGKILTNSFELDHARVEKADFKPFISIGDYIEFHHERINWSSPYVHVNALNGRVRQMDLSRFSHIVLEIRGEHNTKSARILIKDANDGMYGEETKVKVEITSEWKTYRIDLTEFETAELEEIIVPFGILFEGPESQTVQIRNISFE